MFSPRMNSCRWALLMLTLVQSRPVGAEVTATTGEGLWAPDRVLVQLRTAAEVEGGPTLLPQKEWVERLGLPPGVTLEELRDGSGARGTDDALDIARPVIAQLHGAISVSDAVAWLRTRADVVSAEPDYIGTGAAVPSDPSYGSQWHHGRIESEAVWDVTTGM